MAETLAAGYTFQGKLIRPALVRLRNGPETELRHAVGVLTVPVRVQPPTEGALNWRRGDIAFVLEAKFVGQGR